MGRKGKPSWIGIAARLGAAAALGAMTSERKIEALDRQAAKAVDRTRKPDMDQLMPVVTDLGSLYALGGLGVVLTLGGARRLAGRALIAGGMAWVAAQGMKPLYDRSRPYQDGIAAKLVRTPAGTSYPSGHPAVAAAVTRVLAPDVKWPASALFKKIPDVVAFSRVYNGVHHASDVMGGVLLGRAVGDLVLRRSLR